MIKWVIGVEVNKGIINLFKIYPNLIGVIL